MLKTKKEQQRLFFFYSEAGIYCDFEKSQHGVAVWTPSAARD